MTRIGCSFNGRRRLFATGVGVAVVVAALAVWQWAAYGFSEARATLALLGTALLIGLSDCDAISLGLRLSPVQGWWYWFRTGLVIGAVVGVLVLAGWLAQTYSR